MVSTLAAHLQGTEFEPRILKDIDKDIGYDSLVQICLVASHSIPSNFPNWDSNAFSHLSCFTFSINSSDNGSDDSAVKFTTSISVF